MVDWKVLLGELMTQLLRVLIPVLVALIAKWAIQLYEEIKKNQPDFALVLQTAVNQAVIAAEQMLKTEDGKQKKEYAIASVQDYLAQKGMIVDVGVIEDAIEATVYSLHRENFFLTKEQREQQNPPVYEVEEEGEE
jgi:hypothetical protein